MSIPRNPLLICSGVNYTFDELCHQYMKMNFGNTRKGREIMQFIEISNHLKIQPIHPRTRLAGFLQILVTEGRENFYSPDLLVEEPGFLN